MILLNKVNNNVLTIFELNKKNKEGTKDLKDTLIYLFF